MLKAVHIQNIELETIPMLCFEGAADKHSIGKAVIPQLVRLRDPVQNCIVHI